MTLCLILFDSLSYAAPIHPADRPSQIKIPSEFGTIEESSLHSSNKTIIYIQDAHDSLEAQENIAKIIQHLVEHDGVKTVYEEGYEGPVPSDEYFGFIKDPRSKKRFPIF